MFTKAKGLSTQENDVHHFHVLTNSDVNLNRMHKLYNAYGPQEWKAICFSLQAM